MSGTIAEVGFIVNPHFVLLNIFELITQDTLGNDPVVPRAWRSKESEASLRK